MSEEWNFVRKSKKNNKISEDTVIGRFSMSSNSFAFIKDINNENIREVFISKGKTLNSINGDIVKAKIIEKNKKGFEGQVIEVIKRKNPQCSGFFLITMGFLYIVTSFIVRNDIKALRLAIFIDANTTDY